MPSGACRLEQPAGLMRLEGPDALRVLHGQTSASIEGAQAGSWIPTCCITATARLRALAEVLVDGAGAWLLVGSGDPAAVHQAIDRVLFPADRASLGPLQAVRWITPLGDGQEQLASSAPGSWQPCGEGEGGGWQLGNTLVLPLEQPLPPELAQRRPLEHGEAERWRIQQGLPAAPGELNDDHNPFELGLAGRVGLSKGCYVGQETLAKLATYDGVKQQLRRWHWRLGEGGPAPEAGQGLFNPGPEGGSQEGRLGRITSVLELADGDRIGLAMVRRAGLEQAQLLAGKDPGAAQLNLSLPEQFLAPPVGAGGG
jgi:folate-binding protein YgfZ